MPVRIVVALATLMAITVTAAVLLWPRAGPASAGGPTLVGDVNCDGTVTVLDALFVLYYDAGLVASLPCPQNADVNEDGSIDAIDAALLIQFCPCPFDGLPLPPPARTSTPSGPPGPSPTPTPTPTGPLGDVNCDEAVNAIDAAFVLQFDAGLINSLPCQQNADVNGDGIINAIDAALLIQFVAEPWFD